MILQLSEIYKQTEAFDFREANPTDINKIIESLNSKIVTSSDRIHPKFVKIVANTTDAHITKILIH